MNEICKQSTMEKLAHTIEVEKLENKAEIGRMLGTNGTYLSMILNKKYWAKCPKSAWEAVLNWLNSGYTLSQYVQKYPAPSGTKIEKSTDGKNYTEVATVPVGTKSIELPKIDKKSIEPKPDKPAEQVIKEAVISHPLAVEALQSKQEFTDTARLKIALDIEINLVVNGHKVSMI